MQVKQEDIKRPSLIEMCLDKELFPDNSIATYIDCITKPLNVVHKRSVTPDTHDIEKSLSNEYIRFSDSVVSDFSCPLVRSPMDSELFYFDNNVNLKTFGSPEIDIEDIMSFHSYLAIDDSFSIFSSLSRLENGVQLCS